MEIYYEWDIEEMDLNRDIQDHNHSDTLLPLLEEAARHGEAIDGEKYSLVLVFNEWTERLGVGVREWAYTSRQGMAWPLCLPTHFDTGGGAIEEDSGIVMPQAGHKVPARFHRELRKAQKALRPKGLHRNEKENGNG